MKDDIHSASSLETEGEETADSGHKRVRTDEGQEGGVKKLKIDDAKPIKKKKSKANQEFMIVPSTSFYYKEEGARVFSICPN